jgi:hypothetical protein
MKYTIEIKKDGGLVIVVETVQTGMYTIRDNGYGKQAIFNGKGDRISGWFDKIYPEGLVMGQSACYKVKNNNKYAIFDKWGNMITPEWFDWIEADELLIEGDMEYRAYKDVVFSEDGSRIISGKYAKFDVFGNNLFGDRPTDWRNL